MKAPAPGLRLGVLGPGGGRSQNKGEMQCVNYLPQTAPSIGAKRET